MAYRYGNRYQIQLLPKTINEYIASDDPVYTLYTIYYFKRQLIEFYFTISFVEGVS